MKVKIIDEKRAVRCNAVFSGCEGRVFDIVTTFSNGYDVCLAFCGKPYEVTFIHSDAVQTIGTIEENHLLMQMGFDIQGWDDEKVHFIARQVKDIVPKTCLWLINKFGHSKKLLPAFGSTIVQFHGNKMECIVISAPHSRFCSTEAIE